MKHKFLTIRGYDILTPALAVLLAAFSVINIYSACIGSNDMQRVYIQCGSIALGLAVGCAMLFVDIKRLSRRSLTVMGAVSAVMLMLPLFIGFGKGNISWLPIPGTTLSFQSSEFVKPVYIITLAAHIDYRRRDGSLEKPLNLLLICLHGLAGAGLVAAQGDIGSAAVYMLIFVSMLFASGLRLRWFAGAAVAAICAAPLLWKLLGNVRRARLIAGVNPASDPLGYGYQALLSMNAISEGGIFGKGWQNSTVAPIIPACCTDMMLARISEEFGSAVALLVIALLCVIIIRILFAQNAKGMGGPAAVGIGAWMLWQTVESVCMCAGMLPIVGVTLPFLSCGGSSMASLLIGIGIAVSIKKHDISD